MKMHQSKYAEKMLERFKMSECHYKCTQSDLGTIKINFGNKFPVLEDPRSSRKS